MTDLLGELDRLRQAIENQHPCDARMYGLEVCDLAAKILTEPPTEPPALFGKGITIDVSHLAEELGKIGVLPNDEGIQPDTFADGYPFLSGAPDPGPSVTHVTDVHEQHWWRMSNGRWWTTLDAPDRPVGDRSPMRKWDSLLQDKGPLTNRPEQVNTKSGMWERGAIQPVGVDHVIDKDGDHWWLKPGATDHWLCTEDDDKPPTEWDDRSKWDFIANSYAPLRQGLPQSSYHKRDEKDEKSEDVIRYNEDNPPTRKVLAVENEDDPDVVFFAVRPYQGVWRKSDDRDSDVKQSGFWTWDQIMDEFSGDFVKSEQQMPNEFTAPLKWTKGDLEPHESHNAVICRAPRPNNIYAWRHDSDEWMLHNSYYTPPTEWDPDKFLTWDELLERSADGSLEEILGKKG